MLTPSHTLEIRAYLNEFDGFKKNVVLQLVLEETERFMTRMAQGPFRLRNEKETNERLPDIRKTLAAVSGTQSEQVEVSLQSLEKLIGMEPEGQMLIYSVAYRGSVGRVLQKKSLQDSPNKAPFHEDPAVTRGFETYRERVFSTLEDLIIYAMRAGGLTETLRDSRYGGFAPIFERSIILYFCWLFSFVHAGDTARVTNLLPLAKMFRSNMPIGRYNDKRVGASERWLVFTE